MRAIDTNVVIRFLTQDDPDQSAKANALITREPVFVSLTVMLEAEWVLRSVYGFKSMRIIDALGAFAGLPNVKIHGATTFAKALDYAARGMDFADALHLSQADGCGAFVSFDARLVKAAKRAGSDAVRLLS